MQFTLRNIVKDTQSSNLQVLVLYLNVSLKTEIQAIICQNESFQQLQMVIYGK
jgi:hypothetical protein